MFLEKDGITIEVNQPLEIERLKRLGYKEVKLEEVKASKEVKPEVAKEVKPEEVKPPEETKTPEAKNAEAIAEANKPAGSKKSKAGEK